MTRSLQAMRDWLVECGVTTAAMGSTSAYWKGAFDCLGEVMEVWLVNAAHIKASRVARPTSRAPSGSPSC